MFDVLVRRRGRRALGPEGRPPSCSRATAHVPTLDELVEHCRTRLAGYKVPRELHLVDEMPRQPSGKPDYPRARTWIDTRRSHEQPLTEMFGIEFPIFAFSHCRDVVAAVTNAGGMGVLGALAFSPERARDRARSGSTSTSTASPTASTS